MKQFPPLTEVDYKIYLGQLLLKYFDNDKNEIIMLNFEKGDKNNKKYKNQIEISYSKNEMSIKYINIFYILFFINIYKSLI